MENKTLEKTREAIEAHIQMIIRKGGNMTPMDIEIITKDICALEAIKRVEGFNGDYAEHSYRYYDGNSGNSGYSGHSINDRMIDRLERMFDEAQNDHERQIVREWINRIKSN